jgi:hypothetical protein
MHNRAQRTSQAPSLRRVDSFAIRHHSSILTICLWLLVDHGKLFPACAKYSFVCRAHPGTAAPLTVTINRLAISNHTHLASRSSCSQRLILSDRSTRRNHGPCPVQMQVPERLVQGCPKAMLPCSANTTIGLPIPLDRLFVDKGAVGVSFARERVLPWATTQESVACLPRPMNEIVIKVSGTLSGIMWCVVAIT